MVTSGRIPTRGDAAHDLQGEPFNRILGLPAGPLQLMRPQPDLTVPDPLRPLPSPSDILSRSPRRPNPIRDPPTISLRNLGRSVLQKTHFLLLLLRSRL